jgi:hypothetical protein
MAGLLGLVVPVAALVAGGDFQNDDFETFDSGDGAALGGLLLVYFLFWGAIAVIQIAGMWKAFDKAGEPGWAAIIPIYNIWIMIKIADKEGWWLILFLIPCVNIVAAIVVMMAFAEKFGKEAIYGLGLAFLGVIFWPMLGFGSSQYVGAGAGGYPQQGGYPPQQPPGPPPGQPGQPGQPGSF